MRVKELVDQLAIHGLNKEVQIAVPVDGAVTRELRDVTTGHVLDGSHILAKCDGGDCIPSTEVVVLVTS